MKKPTRAFVITYVIVLMITIVTLYVSVTDPKSIGALSLTVLSACLIFFLDVGSRYQIALNKKREEEEK